MLAIRRPRKPPEVRGQRGVDKGLGNRMFQHEVVHRIVCGIILGWRGEPEYSNGPVVARRRKIFIGRVKSDAFDVARVVGQGLEFLKCKARPYHHLRVQAYRYQYCSIEGPAEVLHVVVVTNQSAKDAPILNRGRLV